MRRVLMAVALVPFVAGIVFHAVGPSASPAVESPPRPGLAFDQYLVDLGPVPPRKFAYGAFAFTNVTDHRVTVRDIKPSCGCLNPQLKKREYGPGERGEFYVRVMIPNESPGAKEYTIDVHYDDPEPQVAHLTFKAVLPDQQVIVRPRAMGFHQLGSEPTSQDIVVTDFRSKPLKVTGVECASPLITAVVGATQEDDEGNTHTRITVTAAGKVPPGVHWADLTIRTDDPNYATLQVPLQVQGPPAGGAISSAAPGEKEVR